MPPMLDIDWVRRFGGRYGEAWNAQDPGRIEPLIDEEIRWRDPAMHEPAEGIAAVTSYLMTIWRAFPDHHVEFLPWLEDPFISADGGAFAVSWMSTGTFTGDMDPPGLAPTSRGFSLEGMDVWRFRDGRLWTVQSRYDLLGFCRQIGLLPARGSPTERMAVYLQRLSIPASRFSLTRSGASRD
jgi:SnoaL-like polyketide cyclase